MLGQTHRFGGNFVPERFVMLYKDHRGRKGSEQPLDLHPGVDVDIIERLVPYIQMCLLAETLCQQHFFLLPGGKVL